VRILQGTKVVDAPQGWRTALVLDEPRVIVDVGAGDGRWAYESARHEPDCVYIAIDPDATGLAEYAYRASRKAARGGIDNAAFVVAPVEALSPELNSIADVVRVNFPWGSLLRGLLLPDAVILHALAALGKPDSEFEAVMSYDPSHDPGAFSGETLPALDEEYIDSTLVPAYAEAGIAIEARRLLAREEALKLPSTWGRRLLHARPRDVFLLEGTFVQEALIR
jgi:16S rRNA (adenine(1408)-N(1))-methyltransferase